MCYGKFYSENSGKLVRVEMTDGEVFTGELFAYISELDNEPDPESIIVDNGMLIELYTHEIKSICAI